MKLPAMKRPPAWVSAGIVGIAAAFALILALALHLGIYALWDGLGLLAIGMVMAFRAFGRLGDR
jgi:hypothetical protein